MTISVPLEKLEKLNLRWILPAKNIKSKIPNGDWLKNNIKELKSSDIKNLIHFNREINTDNIFIKKHKDGWIIVGIMENDWYSWVIDFHAFHPDFGDVWRVKNHIFADSKLGYENFIKNHPLEIFDLHDI